MPKIKHKSCSCNLKYLIIDIDKVTGMYYIIYRKGKQYMGLKEIRKHWAKTVVKGREDLYKAHNGGKKTGCTSACLAYFGIGLSDYRYSQTCTDVVNVLRRKGYTVRSRLSSVKRGSTVGGLRKQLAKLGKGIYLVRVPGHVLLLNEKGETVVDTDSRKRDRRKVDRLYKIS
jgi:hypothetical protein